MLLTSIEFETTDPLDWVSGEDGRNLARAWDAHRLEPPPAPTRGVSVGDRNNHHHNNNNDDNDNDDGLDDGTLSSAATTFTYSGSSAIEWGRCVQELHSMLQDGTCDYFFAVDGHD